MGWSLFGYSYDTVVARPCDDWQLRQDATAYVYNGRGNCYVKGWYLLQAPWDCRAVVHVGESAATTGTCHWEVYEQ